MVELYLRHKDGVVQKHHVNPKNFAKLFQRLVDRTEIVPRCGCCDGRPCTREEDIYDGYK